MIEKSNLKEVQINLLLFEKGLIVELQDWEVFGDLLFELNGEISLNLIDYLPVVILDEVEVKQSISEFLKVQ